MSFLSLAESFKVGAFFFQGKTYFIEKNGDFYSVVLNGRKLSSFEKLKAYYSNGDNKACFLSEKKEIIWVGDKRFEFDINLNPVLNFKRLKFFKLLLKNDRFALIGDVKVSLFDSKTGKIYSLPSLFYKRGRGLFLVQPDNILFSGDCFVFYSAPYLIVYSVKKEKPVLIKKLNFDFVTCAGFRRGIPYFQFDYRTFVFVDVKGLRIQTGQKAKEDSIVFYGKIGKRSGLKVRLYISGKGLSPEVDAEFKVYKGKDLIFSKTIDGLKVDLKNLTSFRPFVFRQIENAIAVNFLDKVIILHINENGHIDLKVIKSDSYFSIVNGRLLFF